MPIPLAIPLIAAGVSTLAQAGISYSQSRKAKKLAETPRPTMEIPEEQKQALQNAKMMAAQKRAPGSREAEQKMEGDTAAGIGQMKQASNSSAATLGGIASMYGKQQQARTDLAARDANWYAAQQATVRSQLQDMAQWQAKVWDYNKNQPYQADMAASSALRNAATQNFMGAMNNISSTTMALAKGGYFKGGVPQTGGAQ